jgi:hypothetical protein
MFYNPLDPSKDGQDAFIDGIRYHIRNSEEIKEKVKRELKYLNIDEDERPLAVLEDVLMLMGYRLDDLIIADQQELLDAIYKIKFDNQKNLGYNINRKF